MKALVFKSDLGLCICSGCDDNQFTNSATELPSPIAILEDSPIKCPFGEVKVAALYPLI